MPMDPPPNPDASPNDARIAQIWGFSGFFWFNLFSATVPAVVGAWLLVAGANEQNGTAPLVTGIILLAMCAPLCFIFALSLLRPVVLTNRTLKVPKGLRSIEIPLSDVSGIGLIYQYTPGSRSSSGWQLRVWNDTKQIRMARWIVVSWTSSRPKGARARFRTKTDWSHPLAHEDYSYLLASKPGTVARRIYDQVLKSQGSNGMLETSRSEKTIRYDPNQSNITAAWWSPDGTMGRAFGLPTPQPSDQKPFIVGPVNRRRRALSLLVLVGGGLLSLMISGFIWGIQQSTSVHHPDGTQKLIIAVGTIALIFGLGFSAYMSIRLWRRPKIDIEAPRKPSSNLAETGWSLDAVPTGSLGPSQTDVPIPAVKPEIRRARHRVAKFTLLSMPCFAAIGLLAALVLGRTGYLSNGETCAAFLGPPSSHPSLACDAWRHHQFLIFLTPACVLFVIALMIIYLQFRAFKKLRKDAVSITTSSRISPPRESSST